ncbi:hypothetical protein GG344DRAFT_69588 [Lentinula edodes]|nr:hypothetical protein GG344DRAFT_69588 [Lentinula edodes]
MSCGVTLGVEGTISKDRRDVMFEFETGPPRIKVDLYWESTTPGNPRFNPLTHDPCCTKIDVKVNPSPDLRSRYSSISPSHRDTAKPTEGEDVIPWMILREKPINFRAEDGMVILAQPDPEAFDRRLGKIFALVGKLVTSDWSTEGCLCAKEEEQFGGWDPTAPYLVASVHQKHALSRLPLHPSLISDARRDWEGVGLQKAAELTQKRRGVSSGSRYIRRQKKETRRRMRTVTKKSIKGAWGSVTGIQDEDSLKITNFPP